MFASAAQLGASYISGRMSELGQEEANRSNREQTQYSAQMNLATAREQMKFQNYMSSTAYQRARADMTAAGINPILAYQQGGASTPQGAMGTSSPGAPMQSSKGIAVSSALKAIELSQQIKQMNLQNENLKQQNENIFRDTLLKQTMAQKLTADQNLALHSARNVKIQGDILAENYKGARNEGAIDDSEYGQIMRAVSRLSQPLAQGASAVANLRSPMKFTPHFGTSFNRKTGKYE